MVMLFTWPNFDIIRYYGLDCFRAFKFFFLRAQPCLTKAVELKAIMSWFLCYIWGSLSIKTLKKVFSISFQESRESQVSSAAASDNQAPLFSDRTDETDKTITRYQNVVKLIKAYVFAYTSNTFVKGECQGYFC